MANLLKFWVWILFFLTISCRLIHQDIVVPQFLGSDVVSETQLRLKFDVPIQIREAYLDGSDITSMIDGDQIIFEKPLIPGKRYELVAITWDLKKNITQLKIIFYGHNPYPAGVIMNEFTTRHSAKHRERLELYVIKSGNLAGLTLFLGQPGLPQTRFVVLPEYPVKQGQLITLQLRPPAEPTKVKPYDLLLSIQPVGLPNIRGMIVLTDRPESGKILDALAYVDGAEARPATYERQLQWLQDQGVWKGDPIQICGTTPTRSVLRRSKKDSDEAKDWYIVKTGGANFSKDIYPAAHVQNCNIN
ncbi:MAG: hypothetical protein ACRCVN_04780 [Spirochaetia bacterium]